MQTKSVQLKASSIIDDLNSGMTWFKKDDLGYGSIQEKYNARDNDIILIRKNPLLKDADTTITVFEIIDDITNEGNTTTVSTPHKGDAIPLGSLHKTSETPSKQGVRTSGLSENNPEETFDTVGAITDEQSTSAFFNL